MERCARLNEKKSVALTHVSSDIFAILSGRCFDPEIRAAFEGETNPYVKQGWFTRFDLQVWLTRLIYCRAEHSEALSVGCYVRWSALLVSPQHSSFNWTSQTFWYVTLSKSELMLSGDLTSWNTGRVEKSAERRKENRGNNHWQVT